MSASQAISPTALVPIGRALLLGAFGWCLIQGMRRKQDFELSFERLVIGMIALSFFPSAAESLTSLSEGLTRLLAALGNREDLRVLILDAFQKASKEPGAGGGPASFNIPAVLEQAWRTGVWGIMTALVEGVFLIVSFILECAREVLWQLLLFLFPLAAGVFPVFPRMMGNLVVYAIELSLWFPMLCLVEITTGIVARKHMGHEGSWGLYVVAVQVIASILILLIPNITHRFLSGAFSGDFNSQTGIFVQMRRVVQVVKGPMSAAVLFWMTSGLPAFAGTAAGDEIRLYPGYVMKLSCQGKLLVSAVGNEALVRLDAFPKELGCGVLLKPLAGSGRTNLLLETSTGTIRKILWVGSGGHAPGVKELNLEATGDPQ